MTSISIESGAIFEKKSLLFKKSRLSTHLEAGETFTEFFFQEIIEVLEKGS